MKTKTGNVSADETVDFRHANEVTKDDLTNTAAKANLFISPINSLGLK